MSSLVAPSVSTPGACKPRSLQATAAAIVSNMAVSCTPLPQPSPSLPSGAPRGSSCTTRGTKARQHMFLTVTVGGVTYVIDPGFGPFSGPFPIPRDGTPIPGSAPAHRLAHEGNDWVLYVVK